MAADTSRPEVILIGDSHVLALHQGCETLGINAAMLKSGGINWNSGRIRLFAPRKARTPVMPSLGGDVARLEEQLGASDIFASGVPVIASIGFHCGHLSRAFGDLGHVVFPPPHGMTAEEEASSLFASRAMVDAFLDERRTAHIELLKYIDKRCKLTVILPPNAPKNEHKTKFRHNIMSLTYLLADRMRAEGLTVYDPNLQFVEHGQLLPRDWVNDDGFHGSPEYGTAVMEALRARGALNAEDASEDAAASASA